MDYGPVLPDPRSPANRPYVIRGVTYRPLPTPEGYAERGVASWYGADFHNRATSLGERYDMYGISAAHTILPIPTLVRVTNLENNEQLIVRVNDRGPFVKNRLIDLSYGAAKKLGYAEKGTALVQVEAVGPASREVLSQQMARVEPAPSGPATPRATIKKGPRLLIQVGAFQDQANAQRLAQRLKNFGETRVAQTVVGNARFYRVRIAGPGSVDEADQLVDRLEAGGFPGAQIVVE